ncbi:MAG TPA: transposase [Opitutaceae bacterium]|nr:transposase [Opitutaceae bacterium]
MGRKPRIEFEGALYHIYNRGQGDTGPFATPEAARAFIDCLFEAGQRMQWRIHAYALTRDCYHLALETPHGNLTNGVHWLQSAFGNRFHRFHGGPAFHGRYRAVLVEPAFLAKLADFIHLVPVRAGLVPLDHLERFRWSSYRYFVRGPERPRPRALHGEWIRGWGLEDTPEGWRDYARHLEHVHADEGEAKHALGPVSRSLAWGSPEFRRERRRDLGVMARARDWGGPRMARLNRQEWEARLEAAARMLRHTLSEAPSAAKSAPWKVALAAWLKRHTSATNRWLAETLYMGAPDAVSRYVTEALGGKRPAAKELLAVLG